MKEIVNHFMILGSGCGPGVPSFFCSCAECMAAKEDRSLRRTRSSALVQSGDYRILIDVSPDIRQQLIDHNIDSFDEVWITHWHYDHFGGLGELEYYIRLKRKGKVLLRLPPSAVPECRATFPQLNDIVQIEPWAFEQSAVFGDIQIMALPAEHGIETAGILLTSPKGTIAYFTDTAGLPMVAEKYVKGAQWLICDATFYGDNWYPKSHMSVDQAIVLSEKMQVKHTVLTHLSMHYAQAISTKELEAALQKYNAVSIAYDGRSFAL